MNKDYQSPSEEFKTEIRRVIEECLDDDGPRIGVIISIKRMAEDDYRMEVNALGMSEEILLSVLKKAVVDITEKERELSEQPLH